MNQQSGHLSDLEIRECAGTVPGGSPEDVEAHLSQCESCLGRLLEWQRTQFRIGEADAMRPKPSADCSKESDLQEVAAEMASPETSARVLQHASQCDYCGPLLKQYLDDFSEELSPEIEALIDQLPFSQPQWQREKAKEIAGKVRRPFWKKTFAWLFPSGDGGRSAIPIRATAGVLATAVMGIGIARGPAIWNLYQLRQATGSISDGYAQKRTVPVRLTGVKAGPLDQGVQTMGSEDVEDLSWKLNRAEGMLSGKLDPGVKVDPRWLQIAGRILLLKHQPGEAEKKFHQAQFMGMKDLSLDIDLAVAYFEEERLSKKQEEGCKKNKEESGGQRDFERTLEELNKVLTSTHPAPTAEEKKTALYNLAVTQETMGDCGSAISTWEDYLKGDPTGDWADDARRHLDTERKKDPRHPAYLNPFRYNLHSRESAVNRDVEQYLEIGLQRDWLGQAIQDPASEAGKAVISMALTLKLQHCDPMLTDLLSFPGKGGGPPAIRTLSATFTPTQNGEPKDAIDCSKKVAGLFSTRPLNVGPSLRPASAPTPDDGQKKANDCPQKMTFPAGGPSAIQALSAAFTYNKNDEQEEAIGCSRKAAGLFAKSGNAAGELLAGYQEIYALQRELNADGCLEQLDKLWARAFATRYYWLQGQLALEKAICANLAFQSTTERSLELSGDIARDLQFPELRLRILGMKAGIERLNGQYAEAWRDAVDGLAQYWNDEYSSERYYQFYAVIRDVAASKYPHTHEAYLRRSIDVFETTAPEDLGLKFVLVAKLANLMRELGEDTAAEAEAQRVRDLIAEKQGGRTKVPAYLEVPTIDLADFELRRGQPGLALSTLKRIGDAPQTHDNFVQLDFYRVRGDAKLQSGRLDEASADYQRGIGVTQQFFNHSTNNEIKRLSWLTVTNRIYARFVQILLAKGESEKALKVWEWSKRQLLDRTNTQLLDVASQADSLSLQTSYPHIVYASFEDRLQIWLVKDGRAVGKSVPLRQSELRNRIRDFNANCQNKDSLEGEVEKQGAELYNLLLQPVVADLAVSDTVAIEFDDAVPSFAIDALKSPAGRDFGDDHVLLQSPGILAEALLNNLPPLTPQDKVLVADALPEKGLEALPGHDLPVGVIERTYSNSLLLQGAKLTPQDLDEQMKTSAALLVISHGVRGIEGMGLKMTPDWFLRAKDFSPELVRRMRLAVLAACSSGYSENGLPDPDNMVRSLLAGKVPNVIASRWDVDSQSTGELFQSFYTNLGQGETPAQALQHARRAFRKAHPEHTHPYYWAGFYLTGRAN